MVRWLVHSVRNHSSKAIDHNNNKHLRQEAGLILSLPLLLAEV